MNAGDAPLIARYTVGPDLLGLCPEWPSDQNRRGDWWTER
jgi:hypothetical protein